MSVRGSALNQPGGSSTPQFFKLCHGTITVQCALPETYAELEVTARQTFHLSDGCVLRLFAEAAMFGDIVARIEPYLWTSIKDQISFIWVYVQDASSHEIKIEVETHATQVPQVAEPEMTISIIFIGGNRLPVRVKPSDTIESVKNYIYEMENIPYDQQRLIFAGKILHDRDTISKYNLQDGVTVMMFQASGMSIYIQTPTDRVIVVRASSYELIKLLKKKIEDIEGTPAEEQEIIWEGKRIDDNHSLADCHIRSGNIVLAVVRKPDDLVISH